MHVTLCVSQRSINPRFFYECNLYLMCYLACSIGLGGDFFSCMQVLFWPKLHQLTIFFIHATCFFIHECNEFWFYNRLTVLGNIKGDHNLVTCHVYVIHQRQLRMLAQMKEAQEVKRFQASSLGDSFASVGGSQLAMMSFPGFCCLSREHQILEHFVLECARLKFRQEKELKRPYC